MTQNPYVDSPLRVQLLTEMEKQFNLKNVAFFEFLLEHKDNVIRTRSVCILANIAGENAVKSIANVLKKDSDALVRHEAAFSLGQLGFTSAIKPLLEAIEADPSLFVRHEAAIAVGVIGSEEGRIGLISALNDPDEEVRESAKIALANLDYIASANGNTVFSKMTGG
jgi:HEAT repeat protein